MDFQGDGHLGNAFRYFDEQITPILPASFKLIGLSARSFKIGFQDGGYGYGDYLSFPIETIFAFFDLQVTMILSSKFRVKWHVSSI